MYILLKLGPDYLVVASTFHSSMIIARTWKIPSLDNFMESLTRDQDKLVQMGTIKSSKDQDLVAGVLNPSKGKNKAKDSRKQDKKKQERPKSSDGGSNTYKDKDKKNKDKTKCTYFHKGLHPKSACMKKTIDMMVQLLEKNNIPLLEGAWKKDDQLMLSILLKLGIEYYVFVSTFHSSKLTA